MRRDGKYIKRDYTIMLKMLIYSYFNRKLLLTKKSTSQLAAIAKLSTLSIKTDYRRMINILSILR